MSHPSRSWVRLAVQHVEETLEGREISTSEVVLMKFVDDQDGAERFFKLVQECADGLANQRKSWWRTLYERD